ncbi:HNH endonuclease [Paucibacter sp. XJ19-41]|uniref:HNH endonuclease n=1 Tax=Paucibacter sp. XJ19-41 TaxID=2927824 RepID=UPI0023493CCE|nr:hypothetical protein [Paucibacter sp. XJ19-41]MDC6168160.1 hypothetical protein [Paucibacter sp. XJ19-41]
MISLPKPNQGVVQAARLCVSNVENQDLANRVIAIEVHLAGKETGYHALAQASQLFSIAESIDVASLVAREEMKWLYKNKFSKLGQPCREIYDELRRGAKMCPLCNSRVVGTLDHYLPQAKHADYVLTPLNLVPACEACNKIKLSGVADSLVAQTFHPYYDVLPTDQPWLSAEIVEGVKLSAAFHATPPTHWDAGLQERVKNHFIAFGLNDVYIAKASSELSQIADYSRDEFKIYGYKGLKAYLERQAASRAKGDPHSWAAALYRALAASEWFVAGGAVEWADHLDALAARQGRRPPSA